MRGNEWKKKEKNMGSFGCSGEWPCGGKEKKRKKNGGVGEVVQLLV